jgi:hypothetical protein
MELTLASYHLTSGQDTIVSGGAAGADTLAARYARSRDIELIEYRPQLRSKNPTRAEFAAAAYARNQQIVDDCELVIAFTDKITGGTWDTIHRAWVAGKHVDIYIRKQEG